MIRSSSARRDRRAGFVKPGVNTPLDAFAPHGARDDGEVGGSRRGAGARDQRGVRRCSDRPDGLLRSAPGGLVVAVELALAVARRIARFRTKAMSTSDWCATRSRAASGSWPLDRDAPTRTAPPSHMIACMFARGCTPRSPIDAIERGGRRQLGPSSSRLSAGTGNHERSALCRPSGSRASAAPASARERPARRGRRDRSIRSPARTTVRWPSDMRRLRRPVCLGRQRGAQPCAHPVSRWRDVSSARVATRAPWRTDATLFATRPFRRPSSAVRKRRARAAATRRRRAEARRPTCAGWRCAASPHVVPRRRGAPERVRSRPAPPPRVPSLG